MVYVCVGGGVVCEWVDCRAKHTMKSLYHLSVFIHADDVVRRRGFECRIF